MRSLFDKDKDPRLGGFFKGSFGQRKLAYNRPTSRKQMELPPIGVGINYGTITGRGAGGARFFGEGVVNLRAPEAAACPFDVSLRMVGESYKITVRPGTLNGLYATNYADSLSFDSTGLTVGATATSNVVLNVTTDGTQVSAYTIETQANLTAMSPTTPLAPTSFKWPIAHIDNGQVFRGIGCSSLTAVIRESCRISKTPATPDDYAFDVYYYWIVGTVV